ncbi:hypothetical protein [Actinokineospora bangkokensis]|uniref:Uncharacterized protein n=1 Tax=Actinokineospora bangkokensis TaxID=1193682 RepID=A0A1Q9LMY8_9PSEU|nr:hypothetical protein [Actinokineospora bangkokensis]OLR93402.1 hypothetical protein BJP25_17930 [Actinokineospora bangkokensis]
MSSWTDVIAYVRTRYEVLQETDSWLRFRLDAEDGRTQQVAVHHVAEADGREWLEISSAVGRADAVDHARLLELAGTTLVGGAAIADGVALLKHTVPVADLSVREEFERPLLLLVASADAFERELTKADAF